MKPSVYAKEKVWEVQAAASEGKLEMGRRPRGKEADRFHRGSVLTPRTPPGPALPAEPRMETARMATGGSGFTEQTDVTYQTNQRDG